MPKKKSKLAELPSAILPDSEVRHVQAVKKTPSVTIIKREVDQTTGTENWFEYEDDDCPKEFPLRGAWAARMLAEILMELQCVGCCPNNEEDLDAEGVTDDLLEVYWIKCFNRLMTILTDESMVSYEISASLCYSPTGVKIGQYRDTCVASIAKTFGKRLEKFVSQNQQSSDAYAFTPANPYSRWMLRGLTHWARIVDPDSLEELHVATQGEFWRIVDREKLRESPAVERLAAPRGIPGRKSCPEKQKHADRANELRSMLPATEWKECSSIVNAEFNLSGSSKYNKDSIRDIWRLKYGDKKKRD